MHAQTRGIVVLQTDFSTEDGAVGAMKGVICCVNRDILIHDLTHEIPAFDIWQAAYRLYQAFAFWPTGTVFVNVVDPGVGTQRRSIVIKSKTGHYFVGPDNGSFTLIERYAGIESVRQIDETQHRLKQSAQSHRSYTFLGRDLFAYVAAKLAANEISFEEVGPVVKEALVRLDFSAATLENQKLNGHIVILDKQYGNVWTNIDSHLIDSFQVTEQQFYQVAIYHKGEKIYDAPLQYSHTFGQAQKGEGLLYLNSLLYLSVAINQDSFVKKYNIGYGQDWKIEVMQSA